MRKSQKSQRLQKREKIPNAEKMRLLGDSCWQTGGLAAVVAEVGDDAPGDVPGDGVARQIWALLFCH